MLIYRLYFLLIGRTNIIEITDDDLANLPRLTKLSISYSPLETLPDNQRILSKLVYLSVPSTKVRGREREIERER